MLQFASRTRSLRLTYVPRAITHRTPYATLADEEDNAQQDPATRDAWIYCDSVTPIRLGGWDLRHYLSVFREEDLLQRLETIVTSAKIDGLKLLGLQHRPKDGGVFAHIQFTPPATDIDEPKLFKGIEKSLREAAQAHGGSPSWIGFSQGSFWSVRGSPWLEDLHRYPSTTIKVEFEGPDVHQETLYNALRPYGRIVDITRPTPVPAGALRGSNVTFVRTRYAVRAQNCLHGLVLSPNSTGSSSTDPAKLTRLSILYDSPIKAHVIRDWLSSHPKIVLPVLLAFLGTLTYTIFDPIRVFFVEGKMMNWFDYKDYAITRWIKHNTIDRLSIDLSSRHDQSSRSPLAAGAGVWKERKEAEGALKAYLSEYPSTIAFLHGPQGSGKTTMITHIVEDTGRRALVIDCAELFNANTDSAFVSALARQIGYWPVFSFLASMNNMIDLASVGLLGQKAGFSSTLDAQLKDVLQVGATALKGVTSAHASSLAADQQKAALAEERKLEHERRRARIRMGIDHDGRRECIAGNGVMSELGVGDEMFGEYEASLPDPVGGEDGVAGMSKGKDGEGEHKKKHAPQENISGLPIVVIRNYSEKGGAKGADVMTVLAEWSAALVTNKIAHVVVVSDNRENVKQLAKALPTRPMTTVALNDADMTTALEFVAAKLAEADVTVDFTSEQRTHIGRLGGRASDLDALVYKMRNGQPVEAAVEEIITRGVGELRKNAFGDDSEDAKNLPWKREQAWSVLKQLAKKDEISYSDTLLEFPFKGDDAALRAMERAELISISANDGLPVGIRPGKPVYRSVFERLVRDPIFHAVQQIALNDSAIASADKSVRQYEEELLTLRTIGMDTGSSFWSGRGATAARAAFLLGKMKAAEDKIEKLEGENAALRKVFKGDAKRK